MKKVERQQIILDAAILNDNDLEHEYYHNVFLTFGSVVDEMYEHGFTIEDIQERVRYERYLVEKCDILEEICNKRGIKLWAESKCKEM